MSDIVRHDGQHAQQVMPIQFVGAPARIDLLPDEIRRESEVRATRRLSLLGIVAVVVIAAAGYLGATTIAVDAQGRLDGANARTNELMQQQAGFHSVRELQQQIKAITSVEHVAESTRLDWPTIDAHVRAGAPADAQFTNLSYIAQSTTSSVSQLTGIFAKPLIGTAAVTMSVPIGEFDGLTAWLDTLSADPMFSGVTANTVQGQTEWSVTATIALSPSLTPLPVPTKPATAPSPAPAQGSAG